MAKGDYACCARCDGKCVYNPDYFPELDGAIYCAGCVHALIAEERERILNAVTMLHIRDSDLYAQIAAAIRRGEEGA